MTPLVRAMTLFGHGGAWRKNFGLPGRWGSSSSFIVCRKDYSGSRVFPQVKKRAAGNDTLQETENRNSAINSPQTCGRRETQFAAGQWNRAICLCFPELLRPVYSGKGILRMNGAWPISAGNGRIRGVSGKGWMQESAWDKA